MIYLYFISRRYLFCLYFEISVPSCAIQAYAGVFYASTSYVERTSAYACVLCKWEQAQMLSSISRFLYA